tara:strand:- start:3688 stop:4092 length:405 start_codon:yes stop_codon:yes gene_type:complete
MEQINLLAVLIATIISYALGAVWYSPKVFGTAWMEDNNYDPNAQHGHPAKVYGLSFIFSLIAAAGFAYYIMGDLANPTWLEGLRRGLVVGIAFAATSFGINYQFANKSTRLLMIDGGYHTVQFAVYGIVLALWP